jgi:hypothetical protein
MQVIRREGVVCVGRTSISGMGTSIPAALEALLDEARA